MISKTLTWYLIENTKKENTLNVESGKIRRFWTFNLHLVVASESGQCPVFHSVTSPLPFNKICKRLEREEIIYYNFKSGMFFPSCLMPEWSRLTALALLCHSSRFVFSRWQNSVVTRAECGLAFFCRKKGGLPRKIHHPLCTVLYVCMLLQILFISFTVIIGAFKNVPFSKCQ